MEVENTQICSEASFQFCIENISKLMECVLSTPFYVQNLPWKIKVLPCTSMNNDQCQSDNRSLGFYLQCNGESESSSWSCNAMAELRLLSFKPDGEPFVRNIKHLFYCKENDWGYSHYMSWGDIFDPKGGYVQNDTIKLEVHVVAEIPHGVMWDSKKHTGFVGLKNQGATCYMNSLLQTLFFTNQLREAVYKMPTESDDSSKSLALALQSVFHDLQFTDKPVDTKKLTKSFGWDARDSFMQHDVQEFLRVLLDKLESQMKNTSVEGTVPRLFEGSMSSYIKCKKVNFTSTRLETFYDIQLTIKGKKNITESFRDYIDTEILEGINEFDAGEHGHQVAEKGVIFVAFPPVLHLHLMRFQYDPVTDTSVKFNDRFEFYERIHLDDYLQTRDASGPADYTLHAVLVHSGNNHDGHYVVYINPIGDGQWCKFDDDVVSRCSKSEAIAHNYGGIDDDVSVNAKYCSNAYMLVYVRDSVMPTILQEIHESQIPIELTKRLHEEHRIEQVRQRERSEANTYMIVYILLEEYLDGHQTTDMFDVDRINCRLFKIKKTQTMYELMQMLQEAFRTASSDRMRLWPLIRRDQQLMRPTFFDHQNDMAKTVINCSQLKNPWTIFLEILLPNSLLTQMPAFDKERDVLVFFKHYDSATKRLSYCGYGYYGVAQKLSELLGNMNELVGFAHETELTVYEEQSANSVQRIDDLNDTLQTILKVDGEWDASVLVFEKKLLGDENLELPTCEDYFRDLLQRVEVIFVDKTNAIDPGFCLTLSQLMTYAQIALAVGQKLNCDPLNIQFFKCQKYKDIPGYALRSNYDGLLKDLLVYNKPKGAKKIFYQQLSMNITELESKKQFKCIWLSIDMKNEKELILYADKNGTVKTLLQEAARQIELNDDEGSGQLRIVEICNYKITLGPNDEDSLECLADETSMTSKKMYRIEEIPRDETNLADDELLIPVSHFCNDVFNSFGIPFYVKAKQGETMGVLKKRIQKKCTISDNEWEKYKIVFVTGRRLNYCTDDDALINFADFRLASNQTGITTRSYLGLEHMKKIQKNARLNHLEKAFKINN